MVLLSAAIVFAGLGWLGLSSSDSDDGDGGGTDVTVAATTTQAPPVTTSAAPPAPEESEPHTPADISTPSEPPTTTAPTTPNSSAVLRTPVRIYNNSTVDGLAATTADELRAAGWNITDVHNYDSGQIPQSTVYYGTAPGEREAAEKLGQEMGIPAAPRFDGIADAPAGVIVILAGDTAN